MHDGQIICMHGEVGDAHHDTIVKPPLLAVEQHLPGEDHVPGQPPCISLMQINPSPHAHPSIAHNNGSKLHRNLSYCNHQKSLSMLDQKD